MKYTNDENAFAKMSEYRAANHARPDGDCDVGIEQGDDRDGAIERVVLSHSCHCLRVFRIDA
jgi:hypothetical protein